MDPAFHAKVDSLCLTQFTEKVKHQSPDGYMARSPDPAILAEAGAVLDAQPLTHTLVGTAKALGRPSGGAASWAVAITDFGVYEKAARATIGAAKAGNLPAFVVARDSLEDTKTAILDDMRAIGFGVNSPCDLLFAGASGH